MTDSLSAVRQLCFDSVETKHSQSLPDLVRALDADFDRDEPLRQRLLHKTHRYGNDDDDADELMTRIFQTCFEALDGRPDGRGGRYASRCCQPRATFILAVSPAPPRTDGELASR